MTSGDGERADQRARRGRRGGVHRAAAGQRRREFIFINSGTDTFPIQEALARVIEQERAVPQLVLCIDEVTAMFAAPGYFQLTGRPQVVLVHVDAGTAQIGGAYHDVQRDRSGVIVCAGRARLAHVEAGQAAVLDMRIA